MKYLISFVPAHEKVSRVGQWTLAESHWCKVKHIEDGVALLHTIEYPIKLEYLHRYHKVLRPITLEQAPMKSMYPMPEGFKWDAEYVKRFEHDEIIIPDEHWMDFMSRYVTDKDIIIKDSAEYKRKVAVPYEAARVKIDITRLTSRVPESKRSGIEHVISALETTFLKNSAAHDDQFRSHELATSAMYSITKNTHYLGKTVPLPPGRSREQTIADLAEAAAILICEIERISRLDTKP